jgi:AAA domain
MPSLSAHQSSATTKLLFIGDSGSGKTGALASLAGAGYNLRIADLDNGLDVLSNLLSDSKSPYGNLALPRVSYQTLTDPMRNVGGKLIPRTATVWQRLVKLLDNWKTDSEDFGPLSTWTPEDVLVIDSLTLASNAAMNFVCSMNGRLGQQPHQGDWYAAQQLIESLLQMLYDDGIKCNVIISSHIAYIGEENAPQRGYPASLGRALSPRIGRYFNSVLMARTSGSGNALKRKILTTSTNLVELKNTAPMRVKAEYDLATGLADYFKDVRSQTPAKVRNAASSPVNGVPA